MISYIHKFVLIAVAEYTQAYFGKKRREKRKHITHKTPQYDSTNRILYSNLMICIYCVQKINLVHSG